jgi:hypothetical protein
MENRQHKKPRPTWDTCEANLESFHEAAELLSLTPCVNELSNQQTNLQFNLQTLDLRA